MPSSNTPRLVHGLPLTTGGSSGRIVPCELGFVEPQAAVGEALRDAGQRAAGGVRRHVIVLALDDAGIPAEAEEADQAVVIFEQPPARRSAVICGVMSKLASPNAA